MKEEAGKVAVLIINIPTARHHGDPLKVFTANLKGSTTGGVELNVGAFRAVAAQGVRKGALVEHVARPLA